MIIPDKLIDGLLGFGLSTLSVGGYMLIRNNENKCVRTNFQLASANLGLAGVLMTARSLMR